MVTKGRLTGTRGKKSSPSTPDNGEVLAIALIRDGADVAGDDDGLKLKGEYEDLFEPSSSVGEGRLSDAEDVETESLSSGSLPDELLAVKGYNE